MFFQTDVVDPSTPARDPITRSPAAAPQPIQVIVEQPRPGGRTSAVPIQPTPRVEPVAADPAAQLEQRTQKPAPAVVDASVPIIQPAADELEESDGAALLGLVLGFGALLLLVLLLRRR